MDSSLEEKLYKAILIEDYDSITKLILEGTNPNKITKHGKTCLGEAVNTGNINIVRSLIDSCKSSTQNKNAIHNYSKKKHSKSHKRKYRSTGNHDETVIKCKNLNEKIFKTALTNDNYSYNSEKSETNQGYFVFIHSEGSSSDESKICSLKSPVSPPTLISPTQAELEWDEEVVSVAPTTKEDEKWSSMYKWYAAILESTGAAIASASLVTNGIDQQDAFTRTALHYAVELGHSGIVNLMLAAGCKVDIAAGDGLTSLHIAVMKNHREIVTQLLTAGSHVNYKTHEKMTPLHFAASRGFVELVKILVNNGAYVEARDTNERTALYLATARGHVDVVKYLISVGANVNGEEIHGYTPLCEAVWSKYTLLVEILLYAGARVIHSHKLLHNAIIHRQEDIVKLLINMGGSINLHNDSGDTPLLLSARLSQPAVARILLEKGAHVNSSNSITGAGAVHIAAESISNPKIFDEYLMCLLDYGIDLNSTALTGDTALNRALLLHKDHAAVMLIQHGADVNACDLHSCGLDNLSIASRRRLPNLAKLLLKAGHNVPINDQHSIPSKEETTKVWLHHTLMEPFSLTDICRIQIRGYHGNIIMHTYINSLPLPKCLKRFLMLENEG